jgi:hypothetical protein
LGELIFNAFLLFFFLAMLVSSAQIQVTPDDAWSRDYPVALLVIAIAIFAVKVFQIWKKLPAEEKKRPFAEVFNIKNAGVQKLMIAFALIIAYVALLPYGGFVLTTIVFTMGIAWLLDSGSILKSFLAAFAIMVPVYAVFVWGLNVRVLRGVGGLYYISLWLENLGR